MLDDSLFHIYSLIVYKVTLVQNYLFEVNIDNKFFNLDQLTLIQKFLVLIWNHHQSDLWGVAIRAIYRSFET